MSQSRPIDPLQLLAELVRSPSVTPESAGVLDILERELIALGFTVTPLRFEGDDSYPVENLFATRGSGAPHLAFIGHTDVVPPGDRALWTHDPFAADIVDGCLYGRGAADMKSGIAAFVGALSRVTQGMGQVSLLITNDEEADAINGTAKLVDWALAQGHGFDFAIVGEPSATARVGDSIKIGRRGSFNGRITVTGIQGHVAYPDRAKNPLPVAAAIVAALSGKLDDGTTRFPPSNLEFTSVDVGNRVTNVIPAMADLRFNVRYNEGWTPESLRAAVAESLSNLDADGTQISFTVLGTPSRSFLSSEAGAVELLCEVIAARTGQRPEMSTAGGTSDGRFIAPHCPVVEFGLPGPTMHKADERVSLSDLEALTALYADFLTRYLGEGA